jgi:hypothetical protein
MEVWKAKLSGTPTVGDTVFIHLCGRNGGRTSAGHIVVAGDTIEKIRDGIVQSAQNYLIGGDQEIKSRGTDEMMLMLSRPSDGEFVAEVTHAKTEQLTIEKL